MDNGQRKTNNSIDLTDPYEIAKFIKNAKKSTPVKVYIKGKIDEMNFGDVLDFGNSNFRILIGEYDVIFSILNKHKDSIENYYVEQDRRNSAIPLLKMENIQARIEPGAIIRDRVKIEKNAVVAAGSVVTKDVPAGSVVAGIPARIIKEKDDKTMNKVKILNELRG